MSKTIGYGLGQGSIPDISNEILCLVELYDSVSYQKSVKCSFLVMEGCGGTKLCSLSAKAKNKYSYLHTAYVTVIHHINITLQGLTPLFHLGLETRCLAFCVLLSAPDKC